MIRLLSRQELLKVGLLHLSKNYYPRLSNGKQTPTLSTYKYVEQELLEGIIKFGQNDREFVVSVTPFDLPTFQKRVKWMSPSKIKIPELYRDTLLIESLVVAFATYFIFSYQNWITAVPMSLFIFVVYIIINILRADEFGRKLRQSPNTDMLVMIPDCILPANENWLIVGEEMFMLSGIIGRMPLINLCSSQGIGLLIVTQNGDIQIPIHPKCRNKNYGRKLPKEGMKFLSPHEI